MDRLFLDANILFSAAYRPDGRTNELWSLAGVRLTTSEYAVTEARRNLSEQDQRERLDALVGAIEVVSTILAPLPQGIDLPAKDWPILQAAIGCGATHLITGDHRHFGALFGQVIAGVRVTTVREYLSTRR